VLCVDSSSIEEFSGYASVRPELWMHEIIVTGEASQPWKGDCSREEQYVLSVPNFNSSIAPNRRPHRVVAVVAVFAKQCDPVRWKLLIDVMSPTLIWNRRAKQNHVGGGRQIVDKGLCSARWKVFGDFEAHGEIEASGELRSLIGQVTRDEALDRYLKDVWGNVVAVHSHYVSHIEALCGSQPRSRTTAEVNDGSGPVKLKQKSQRYFSGPK